MSADRRASSNGLRLAPDPQDRRSAQGQKVTRVRPAVWERKQLQRQLGPGRKLFAHFAAACPRLARLQRLAGQSKVVAWAMLACRPPDASGISHHNFSPKTSVLD